MPQYLRFAFVVVANRDFSKYSCHECGPRELTVSIFSAVCMLFGQLAKAPKDF